MVVVYIVKCFFYLNHLILLSTSCLAYVLVKRNRFSTWDILNVFTNTNKIIFKNICIIMKIK